MTRLASELSLNIAPASKAGPDFTFVKEALPGWLTGIRRYHFHPGSGCFCSLALTDLHTTSAPQNDRKGGGTGLNFLNDFG